MTYYCRTCPRIIEEDDIDQCPDCRNKDHAMTDHINRFRCTACDTVIIETEILRAPNPFDPQDDIAGCPECRSANCFEMLCDVTGCRNVVDCGWPSADGYRRTCGKHMREVQP